VAGRINGRLGQPDDLGSRMMLDQPQDMTAPSRNGGLAAIQIDGAAEVEAKQLGARR
jgi:hypothetical protein